MPISGLENLCEGWVRILDGELPVLAFDVVWDLIHRTGSIERNGGDDVFKAVRLELDQHRLHAVRLKLKNTVRIP